MFVPMKERSPAEYLVVVIKDDQVLLRELARFEPGRERHLSVSESSP